jgi:Protein of unknown function (DUF3987)
MGSKPTLVTTNVSVGRKCRSWLDRFVQFTDNLEAPLVYRKWTAIATIAAALQQRVWLTTSDRLYPNLYVALVGFPGVGKTRTINKARALLGQLEEFFIGPNDLTKAALVDWMASAQVKYNQHFPKVISDIFNAGVLMADEWGVLLQAYDGDMVPTLTTLYDSSVLYDQWRRTKDLKVKIERPQLNIIAGTTPSNLMKYMPDYAWDQGFTSRLILVYSAEVNKKDHFDDPNNEIPSDLVYDLKMIHGLYGEFEISPEFRTLVNHWRFEKDEKPKPSHPKLAHYNSRRCVHLYKLAMVAAVDRSNDLVLGPSHFHTALEWLQSIEEFMPDIFEAGSFSVDSRIMDEIVEFVARQGKPVSEHKIVRFASRLLPAHSLIKVLHVMQVSERLKQVGDDPITYIAPDVS